MGGRVGHKLVAHERHILKLVADVALSAQELPKSGAPESGAQEHMG